MQSPITINIGVTIDLSDTTIKALERIFGAKAAPQEVAAEPAAEPQETPTPEEAPQEPEQITDEQLRAVIKSVRTKSTPTAVRELFAEFGIKTSIECPMERRTELVARLNSLAS